MYEFRLECDKSRKEKPGFGDNYASCSWKGGWLLIYFITRAAKRILEDLPAQQIRMYVTGIGMVKVVCRVINPERERQNWVELVVARG